MSREIRKETQPINNKKRIPESLGLKSFKLSGIFHYKYFFPFKSLMSAMYLNTAHP